ncbi:SOUL family heme-binding protein [Rhodobacteraceae bacterium nBUS_22]
MTLGMIPEKTKYPFKLALVSIALIFCFIGDAMAYEEPEYDLVKRTDLYEIRRYEDRLAVQTHQSSGEDRAFGRLFRYISGSNQSASKIAMTIPVTQFDDGGGLIMHFFLPKSYSAKTAPTPKADNVNLVTVEGGYYAVRTYSGRSRNENHRKHTAALKEALEKDRITIQSVPIKATYNGPLTPFFLRRNETMFRVKWE